MIRLRHNTRFVFILFQVIAVAIITFGSLINFHQYKIWGKPLIPTFIGYKRDLEKYSKAAVFSKFSHHDHFPQDNPGGFTGVIATAADRLTCGSAVITSSDLSQEVPVSPGSCPCGLRAPPVI
jgi:hypothetical protein